MGMETGEEIKCWTAKRKSALAMEIIQGKKTLVRGQPPVWPAAWVRP